MPQEYKLLQRNFSTTMTPDTKNGAAIYTTIPEKLRDFQERLNDYGRDGFRIFDIIEEKINNANCPIFVLVREA